MDRIKELKAQRAKKIDEARAILDAAKAEERNLTDEETEQYDALANEADTLEEEVRRLERQAKLDESLEKREPVKTVESRKADEDEEKRSGSPDVAVGERRDREARMAHNTLRMLHGLNTRNYDETRNAQRELAKDGWYGDEAQKRAAGDYYSTLVDADGAILLPTAVVQGIEEVGEELGVARRLCTVYNHVVGTLKVPGGSGNLRASAVAEGAAISASMRSFQAISLNPKKWALIVPWTYEASLEVGQQILADAQRAIGRGFAHAEDDALFNGDGTSSYNSIDGILSSNRSSVATYTMGSGDTSFDDIDANDLMLLRREVPAAVRKMGSYVFHPDMEAKLRTLQDGNGSYIYQFNSDLNVSTIGGRPVYYTEVLPDISSDGTSTTFGVYGDFSYFKIALGQGMTSEDLREATVTDADSGANINLATQDLRALKVRELFDMDCNFESVFCEIATAAA